MTSFPIGINYAPSIAISIFFGILFQSRFSFHETVSIVDDNKCVCGDFIHNVLSSLTVLNISYNNIFSKYLFCICGGVSIIEFLYINV
jgi:hypothetical protein